MISKKPGRPRGFDELTALNAAMNVFWAKGYHGASLQDLTDAMGINRPSLYGSFGDKRRLYLKVIEHYAKSDGVRSLVAFEAEPDIEKAVRAFLEESIDQVAAHESGVCGCLLSSCVATNAGEVDGVDQLLRQAIYDTEQRLTARFDAERESGVLPKAFPSLERARLMSDFRLGHAFRARAGVDQDTLALALDFQVRCVLANN